MIIGVSAKKQGGKSTMVNVLRELLPDSQVMRFADFLKEIVLTCFVPADWGWTIEDLDHDDNKNRETPCGWTVRKLLQIVGTDWFRHTYPDCWITAFQKRAAQVGCTHILVPDVRFPNELRAIQEIGGVAIRLLRAPFGDEDQHESETALDDAEWATRLGWHITSRQSRWRFIKHYHGQYGIMGALKLHRRHCRWGEEPVKFDWLCNNQNMTMDEQAQWTQKWIATIVRETNG